MKYYALKIRNCRVLLCLLLFSLSFYVHSDSDDGLVFDPNGAFISTTGHATLTSYAMENHDVSFKDVLKLDASRLFDKGADMTNGIKGTVQSGGWIDLKAFVYDRDHNKQIIYHARFLEGVSTEAYSVGTPQTEYIKIHKGDSTFDHDVSGTHIKELLQSANNLYHINKDDLDHLKRVTAAHSHLVQGSRDRRGLFGALLGGAVGAAVGYLVAATVIVVATGAGIAATVASGGTAAPLVTLGMVALIGGTGAITGHKLEEAYIDAGHQTILPQADHDYNVSVGEVAQLGSTEKVDFDTLSNDRKVIPIGTYPAQVVLEMENASFYGALIPGIPVLTPNLFKVWSNYTPYELNTAYAEVLWLDEPGVLDENDNEVAGPELAVDDSVSSSAGSPYVNLIINGTASDSTFSMVLQASEEEGNRDVPTFHVGDHVTLEVQIPIRSGVSFDSNNPDHYPKLEAFPFTWMAFFSGEVLFQCEPSIQPGEWRPWLGYDSQVHGTAMRKYPPNFNPKLNGWHVSSVGDGRNVHFRWTGKFTRRMSNTDSVPIYSWNKQKQLTDNSGQTHYQRNNQKEGLNMELLRAWKDHTRATDTQPDFAGYNSNRILPGLDPDEFLYLRDSNGVTTDIITLDGEPWKHVPSDESFNPLNDIVTAYQKNRMWHVGNKDYRTVYGEDYASGSYEIQDIGTARDRPNGEGQGNKAAPGRIVVHLPDIMDSDTPDTIPISFEVDAPLDTDKGFYGNIRGPEHTAVWEKGLVYQISGLRKDEAGNYAVSFIYEDSFGRRKYLNFFSSQVPAHIRNRIIQNGEWYIAVPSMLGYGYYSVNLWYNNTTYTDSWTRIGGKELLDINLRFLSVPGSLASEAADEYPGIDLKESPGDGAYIYLEDYLDNKNENYSRGMHGRYTKNQTRTYVFHKGDTTTFEVFDADPHTFVHRGTEWYLSERTQAKRLTDAELADKVIFYVDPIKDHGRVVEDHTIDGTGKKFIHQWNTTGIYQLKVVFREYNSVAHRIIVVDPADRQNGIKADISSRNLTSQEIAWAEYVGISFNYSNRILHTVENLDSYYRYQEGPRMHDLARQINRFHPGLDYADGYKWKLFEYSGGGPHFYTYAQAGEGITYLWPKYMESTAHFDDGGDWLPDVFVRHTSEKNSNNKPMPDDIANGSVSVSRFSSLSSNQQTRINQLFNDVPEPWQVRLPWISFVTDPTPYGDTDVLSYRTRTNIKVIYDMNAFFDNETGAFSGNPVSPINDIPDGVDPVEYLKERGLYLHLMDDETKLKRVFLGNLATGRSIISIGVYSSFGLSVRNAKEPDTIIARKGYPSGCPDC